MISVKYRTITEPALAETKEAGSKFLGYAFPLQHFMDWKSHLDEVKDLHPKATHHCFAYTYGRDHRERANDDGEPSGTAGRPILGQINSLGLNNVLVIVVRYFGGKKLGVPGLIAAYRACAGSTLEGATFKEAWFMDSFSLSIPYHWAPGCMQLLKGLEAQITGQFFEDQGQKIHFQVRCVESESLEMRLHTLVGGIYPDEWRAGKRAPEIHLDPIAIDD